jgi:hypothetical protein
MRAMCRKRQWEVIIQGKRVPGARLCVARVSHENTSGGTFFQGLSIAGLVLAACPSTESDSLFASSDMSASLDL